jgi:hypothetical protein
MVRAVVTGTTIDPLTPQRQPAEFDQWHGNAHRVADLVVPFGARCIDGGSSFAKFAD